MGFDLQQAKVIGKEDEFTPEVPETPEASETPETPETLETPELKTEELEAPESLEAPEASKTEEPEAPKKEEPANDFPSDRFGGKYKSWDEVNEALSKPAPEPRKFDEFLEKVINKYETDGNLEDFFKAYSVNYEKMSDEELVKRDFFAKNSDFSEKALKKAWEDELAKYKLDPDEHDEEDVEIAAVKMKREAEKLRKEGIENQKNYLQPQKQQEQVIDPQKIRDTISGMPEVQKLIADKKVNFSVEGNDIAYELSDSDFALSTMHDEKPFFDLFLDNGRPNVDKWAKVVEFAKNPDKILKTVLDQGIAMGQKLIEKELKNPSIPNQQPEKFNGSTRKERFLTTMAEQSQQTN